MPLLWSRVEIDVCYLSKTATCAHVDEDLEAVHSAVHDESAAARSLAHEVRIESEQARASARAVRAASQALRERIHEERRQRILPPSQR